MRLSASNPLAVRYLLARGVLLAVIRIDPGWANVVRIPFLSRVFRPVLVLPHQDATRAHDSSSLSRRSGCTPAHWRSAGWSIQSAADRSDPQGSGDGSITRRFTHHDVQSLSR